MLAIGESWRVMAYEVKSWLIWPCSQAPSTDSYMEWGDQSALRTCQVSDRYCDSELHLMPKSKLISISEHLDSSLFFTLQMTEKLKKKREGSREIHRREGNAFEGVIIYFVSSCSARFSICAIELSFIMINILANMMHLFSIFCGTLEACTLW